MANPVMLVILDGFGLAPAGPGNAVDLADTPNFDRYWAKYPHTQLEASGEAVGLPKGQMGNSEVGHLNIGAGRVVMQSLSFIQRQIDSGDIRKNEVITRLFDQAERLHFMGLVSDGGVHSDIQHLFGLLDFAATTGKPCFVHVFTDGRDTAPDSGLGFVKDLDKHIKDLNTDIRFASVTGRYFAMDRDNRWDRVKQAYDAVVCGQADYRAESAEAAVQAAYDRDETDEFIKATVIQQDGEPVATVQDNDGIFFFNFRADRARELTYALLGDKSWDKFERCATPKIHYASLMQYDKELDAPFALELPSITLPLAEVISKAGKTQYHTAETEKYPHVTFFFNAQIEEPFPGESRQIIPSPKDVPTYDYKPQMSAPELTEATLKRIKEHDDDFILINFANPDMVGHTGVIEAAIKACEAADKGLGQLVEAIQEKSGSVIVIADHGNAEKMLTEEGKPHTAHTTNPVPCVLISDNKDLHLRDGGVLGDVAPTVLALMGLGQPREMTGKTLIE
ncbi:MAG: 2,3-bisphosphoglycerate-independent phosphoglycerate mutase [Trueperaceae bacterium]|nr:2,3-bisphosphoglycerate-independent phosphoglycerate mutase [Trueperaceae bacterium]